MRLLSRTIVGAVVPNTPPTQSTRAHTRSEMESTLRRKFTLRNTSKALQTILRAGTTVRTVNWTLPQGEIMQSLEMKPMFLPDVQNNPRPSPYLELIRSAQDSRQEYWQIWHLFAFRPEMTAHLARFTHGLMHESSPLSSGLRELIAAYTSYLNQCEFCAKSHAAISAELMGSEDLVWSVLRDLESSSLPENEKALMRFVGKVTTDLASVDETDTKRLRAIGWTDEAIFYALTVTALFNFYNRWVTASGVHAVSHEGHRCRAKVMAQNGYIRK
jgi:uncharacterized peroxidase-related enzyme